MLPIKIVITGPESTGKSVLALQLSQHFKGALLEEYAREYISGLNRQYNYRDIEIIGRKQITDLKRTVAETNCKMVFIDTYLIITKVWFEVMYKSAPDWIEEELLSSKIDLFLLCFPDLPWIKDKVRENGGKMREWLYNEYEKNLIKYNFAFRIVDGFGVTRLKNAINHVDSYLSARNASE